MRLPSLTFQVRQKTSYMVPIAYGRRFLAALGMTDGYIVGSFCSGLFEECGG